MSMPTFKVKMVNGEYIDLSVSDKFVEHYNKSNSYSDYIINLEINSGMYEDNYLSKFLTKNGSREAVVVDAGANVGLFAAHVFPHCKRVLCIEPTPSHFAVLSDVVAKTEMSTVVQCHQLALNNYDGTCMFEEVDRNTTENKISSSGVGYKVDCCTVKSFFNKNNLDKVDLFKLDIEGGEEYVLLRDPTVDSILRERCKVVYVEAHSDALVAGVTRKMQSLGFSVMPAKRTWAYYFVNVAL